MYIFIKYVCIPHMLRIMYNSQSNAKTTVQAKTLNNYNPAHKNFQNTSAVTVQVSKYFTWVHQCIHVQSQSKFIYVYTFSHNPNSSMYTCSATIQIHIIYVYMFTVQPPSKFLIHHSFILPLWMILSYKLKIYHFTYKTCIFNAHNCTERFDRNQKKKKCACEMPVICMILWTNMYIIYSW